MSDTEEAVFAWDCRYFRGDKPCCHRRACLHCAHYRPIRQRILIIKLGAMGDVIRTTPILTGLRKAFPDSHITWLTLPNIMPLLEGIGIDRLLADDWRTTRLLLSESFDIAVCLDKETDVLALMNRVSAVQKFGFLLGKYGQVVPAGDSSTFLFHLGVSDELKFRVNRKSYTELVFDCLQLPYSGEKYLLPELPLESTWARETLQREGCPPGRRRIAFNTGAGPVFATKKWTSEGYAELGRRLLREFDAHILLLGGESEKERNLGIAEGIAGGPRVSLPDTRDSIRRLTALIGECDLMVTSDTLGMHLAIGQEKPAVALFGPTCAQEVDLFGHGEKIVGTFECCPCYLSACPKEISCMEALEAETVLEACRRQLSPGSQGR